MFTVTQCNPHVEALPQLVKRLNESNDFSEFVKAVRAEFVKSVQ